MNYKKLFSLLIFLAIFSFLFNFNVSNVKAMTLAELQALIQQLQQQIAQLQQQLVQMQAAEKPWCYDFNVNLRIEDSGAGVKALQTALEKEGFYQRSITGNFDEYTASAVVGFQEKYRAEVLTPWGLTRGTGFVGSTTRAKLNKLYGCGVTPLPPVEKPYIKVLSPNGGEIWIGGQTYSITWRLSGVNKIKIAECAETPLLTTKYTCHELAGIPDTGIDATIGNYKWYVDPNDPFIPGQVKIKIWDVSNPSIYDESDNYFSIVSATTMVTCIRETTKAGVTCGGYFYEDYCENLSDGTGYANRRKCNASTGNACSSLVNVDRTYCSYGCQNGACKTSPSTPSITVTYPTAGETLQKGTNTFINLQFSPSVPKGGFVVNLLRSDTDIAVAHLKYCGTTGYTQDSAMPINVSWAWKVGYDAEGKEIPIGSYRIFVYDCGDKTDPVWTGSTASAKSNAFSIVEAAVTPSISIISPSAGVSWSQGSTYEIKWKAEGLNTVSINLIDYTAAGGRFGQQYGIASNVDAIRGSYSWKIPSTIPSGSWYKVVVGYEGTNAFSGFFKITTVPSITVTYPTAGETLQKGTNTFINLQFSPSVPKGGFVVNLLRSDTDIAVAHLKYCGTTGYTQDSAMPINVSWAWKVGYDAEGKEIPIGSYRIFVYDCGDKTDPVWTGSVASAKSGIFNIVSITTTPSITVTYPNTGGTFQNGSTMRIEWTYLPLPPDKFAINLWYGSQDVAVAHLKYCDTNYTQSDVAEKYFSWNWNVGYDADGKIIPLGSYRIYVYNCGNVGDASDVPFSTGSGGLGLNTIENQLASISEAISQLTERLKELMKK